MALAVAPLLFLPLALLQKAPGQDEHVPGLPGPTAVRAVGQVPGAVYSLGEGARGGGEEWTGGGEGRGGEGKGGGGGPGHSHPGEEGGEGGGGLQAGHRQQPLHVRDRTLLEYYDCEEAKVKECPALF